MPTGGGKTVIGGHAIARAKRALPLGERSLTVWLVPTDAIRTQTLRVLKPRRVALPRVAHIVW